jgi:hypothetical protein
MEIYNSKGKKRTLEENNKDEKLFAKGRGAPKNIYFIDCLKRHYKIATNFTDNNFDIFISRLH